MNSDPKTNAARHPPAPQDDGALQPCEFSVERSAATRVTLEGFGGGLVPPIAMTQMPGGLWIARLVLTPSRYTVRVSVTEPDPDVASGSRVACWESEIEVPALRSALQASTELRFRLNPTRNQR